MFEKEATEWVRQKFPMLDLKQSDMLKIHEYEAYIAGAELREKRIAELEKENAELKHQLNKNPCVCSTEWHCNDCLEQLTKARELLKMVLEWQYRCGNGHPTWQEVCAKIEQFISEVEK